jgi:hypothetical protein
VEGGVICACAEGPQTVKPKTVKPNTVKRWAVIINVAESTDLMTNPGRIVERSLTSRQLSTSAW